MNPIPNAHLVSVVIPTHNRADRLAEALDSVLALQGDGVELDVIVVNDASSDHTSEVIGRYPVRRFDAAGGGVAAARNIGLEAAKGAFVLLLDDDDVLLPTAIVSQLAVFDEQPEVAAVYGQAQLASSDLSDLGIVFPEGPLTSGAIFEELLGYHPQIGTILVRTEAAREGGGFQPKYPGDAEWAWHLEIARRHPVARIEVPVMLFRQRYVAEEEVMWHRAPGTKMVFDDVTRDLGWRTRLRLRPKLWKQEGWISSIFLNYARDNWAAGEKRRARRSVMYAFRVAPAHALAGCVRDWPFKKPR